MLSSSVWARAYIDRQPWLGTAFTRPRASQRQAKVVIGEILTNLHETVFCPFMLMYLTPHGVVLDTDRATGNSSFSSKDEG